MCCLVRANTHLRKKWKRCTDKWRKNDDYQSNIGRSLLQCPFIIRYNCMSELWHSLRNDNDKDILNSVWYWKPENILSLGNSKGSRKINISYHHMHKLPIEESPVNYYKIWGRRNGVTFTDCIEYSKTEQLRFTLHSISSSTVLLYDSHLMAQHTPQVITLSSICYVCGLKSIFCTTQVTIPVKVLPYSTHLVSVTRILILLNFSYT